MIRAVGARWSIAWRAASSRSALVTVAVTSIPKFTRPAPRASSVAVAAAARCSTSARADGRAAELTRKSALRLSCSTMRAARAESIGRYSSVTRLRSMSPCGRSSRCSTPELTSPRGACVIDHVTENAPSWR